MIPLCGLTFPNVKHSTIYQNHCPYLRKNLPSTIGSANVLDLRLLTGDLDNPNAKTPAVASVLKILQDAEDLSFVDVILLLSGSGFGKTKTVYDVAKIRYTILLDASSENEDLLQMSRRINSLKVLNHQICSNM